MHVNAWCLHFFAHIVYYIQMFNTLFLSPVIQFEIVKMNQICLIQIETLSYWTRGLVLVCKFKKKLFNFRFELI